jgi:hypothetical protein
MHEIKLSVRDHEVSVAEVGGTMVAGTVDHWTLSADFDAEWDGLLKRVTFACGEESVTCAYEDGMAVPWEVFVPGKMRFGFVGVGGDGLEVVRTARMRDGAAVHAQASDMGDEAREATEDVVHEAKRRLDDLSQAVDEAQGTVADAREAATLAKDAAAKADGAASKASTAAGRAEGAATSAEGSAMKAETAAGRADASADGADEAAAKAAGTVARVDGELTLMLGNPTDEDMWLYATGQADGTSGTPALDNASDEDMMGYIGGEA